MLVVLLSVAALLLATCSWRIYVGCKSQPCWLWGELRPRFAVILCPAHIYHVKHLHRYQLLHVKSWPERLYTCSRETSWRTWCRRGINTSSLMGMWAILQVLLKWPSTKIGVSYGYLRYDASGWHDLHFKALSSCHPARRRKVSDVLSNLSNMCTLILW